MWWWIEWLVMLVAALQAALVVGGVIYAAISLFGRDDDKDLVVWGNRVKHRD